MAEWSKALAWSASVLEIVPWVRIPVLPHTKNSLIMKINRYCIILNRHDII